MTPRALLVGCSDGDVHVLRESGELELVGTVGSPIVATEFVDDRAFAATKSCEVVALDTMARSDALGHDQPVGLAPFLVDGETVVAVARAIPELVCLDPNSLAVIRHEQPPQLGKLSAHTFVDLVVPDGTIAIPTAEGSLLRFEGIDAEPSFVSFLNAGTHLRRATAVGPHVVCTTNEPKLIVYDVRDPNSRNHALGLQRRAEIITRFGAHALAIDAAGNTLLIDPGSATVRPMGRVGANPVACSTLAEHLVVASGGSIFMYAARDGRFTERWRGPLGSVTSLSRSETRHDSLQ